jgi:GT2 family glycosyltransferase
LSSTSTYTDTPEVWVAILHWKGANYTRDCLRSLIKLTYPRTKTLLIDNGSPDSSGSALAQEFSTVDYLALPENLGYAGGFNAGIKYCTQRGAQWIWLLNNDTVVEPESLSLLISQALKHPEVAILSAAVHYSDKSVVTGPGEIDFTRAKTYLRPLKNKNDAVSAEWLSGSNMLLRSSALLSEDAFDPAYFLYFEDTEFCVRMRNSGWECLFVPEACIHHAGGASTSGELEFWRAYYYTRNRLLFFVNALGFWKALPAVCSISLHLLRHFLVLPFRGIQGRKQLKAEYLGLRDYLLGRFGKATCLDWAE